MNRNSLDNLTKMKKFVVKNKAVAGKGVETIEHDYSKMRAVQVYAKTWIYIPKESTQHQANALVEKFKQLTNKK